MSDEKVYLDDYSSTNKHVGYRNFIILSILTMGIYDIWWTYRAWRTFKEKDKEDIYPIARAIFNIFFFHALMVKVLDFAKENGYDKTYSPGLLIVAYIVFYFSGKLPDPFWLISFGSILCYVPIVKAFNYAIENSPEYKSEPMEKTFRPSKSYWSCVGFYCGD